MIQAMNIDDQIRISQIIHSITKLDTRLIDKDEHIIFQSVSHSIPVMFDHSSHEYTQINEQLKENLPNCYYHFINTFGLEYIAVGIWRSHCLHGSIILGPFISSSTVIDFIKEIIIKNNLPISERKHLEHFYQSLQVFSEVEYHNLGEMLVNMCGNHFIHSQKVSSGTMKPILNQDQLTTSIEENKHIIEERYQQQNKLLAAIAKGNKVEVNNLMNITSDLLDFTDRIPGSPLRSYKNIAFVFNTLCRVAAERSGVHPVYLHNISEKFAILIERAANIPNLEKLLVLLTNEYCDLVKSYSSGQYSTPVKKAVDYILLNLGHPLTLNKMAEELHMNASHLSRIFKKETGATITEFINHKRVEEAKFYLQKGDISITEIAFMVGFNDLNYFSKVFKTCTSLTPTQYAKKKSI